MTNMDYRQKTDILLKPKEPVVHIQTPVGFLIPHNGLKKYFF